MEESVSVTLSVPEETIEKMRAFYAEQSGDVPSPYVSFLARSENVVVTAYNKESQGLYKVVFQGKGAEYESRIWAGSAKSVVSKGPATTPKAKRFVYLGDQIGSDEVGTGDFFGPVIVAAAFLPAELMPLMRELGVTDSKQLTDETILSIAPELLKRLDYSLLILPPKKFNEVTAQGNNMNAVKAKMHNSALYNLSVRHPGVALYQDQFAAPNLYYSYLKGTKDLARNIIFATKGESKFPSVAAASCIARYAFLREMKEMGERYGVTFPLGAGPSVNRFAKEFVASHGIEAMDEVAKTSFQNMKKLRG